MQLPRPLLLLLLTLLGSTSAARTKRNHDTHHYYVLEHSESAAVSLADVAHALGVSVLEQAGELPNHWLVSVEKTLSELATRDAASEDPVLARYAELKARAATSSIWRRSEERRAHDILLSIRYLERQTLRQRYKRAPPPVSSSRTTAQRLGIEDPLFTEQWHLINDEFPEHMMNVVPVWDMGLTGKGIITSFVDDGLDYTSLDLKDNFDADDSYDFNDHEDLPTPKLSDDHHGTRCAGQVAAGKNSACGVGIAYESKVAGVRILSGPISDVDEAAALNYGFQNVSIFSCSWGPPDNGKSMEGPGHLIKKAVHNGINYGRGGLGSIFVFASGNGAGSGDQCNFDGYTNSIYSVTVSAIDHKGLHPYYSEPCAANLVVAYSSGSGKQIVTTDRGEDKCSSSHGGTSAAAPNAAGVFALALEARPDLTWRDIQYLCVLTSRQVNPDDPDWETIHSGKPYSYKYGFGALDGEAFVKAAQAWELVKPQSRLITDPVVLNDGTMSEEGVYAGGELIVPGGVTSSLTVTQDMMEASNLESLEHVNIKVWINHARRGDVEVELVSPRGVKSVLAAARKNDDDKDGFPGWMFMTVKHWGEDGVGDWTIKVSDQGVPEERNGTFLGWNIVLWGTAIDDSQAILYDAPVDNVVFPPQHVDPPHPSATPSATKQLTKPTEALDDDHHTVEGENTSQAFTSGIQDDAASEPTETASASASPSNTPTADEGWFSDMANLVSTQKWFFGAMGAVVLFGVGAGVFLWRRRVVRTRERYAALPGDDGAGGGVQMSALSGEGGGPARTKELYDAFGEVSDDEDEDADEQTRLHSRGSEIATGGGLHSGFLDDDEQHEPPPTRYRDEPETLATSHAGSSSSPSGSWVDAAR
ncbi:peptidase S8/S53 domain-containing protein [Schizophyllum amplum]|uniref:Peptidase S8/S53 domain-containing protein n=1 Tax=Schizophyllum amplum TaxID=97359 RepID=A0A550C1K0_9AGAR|nr:peptidase S8/S53 domain-containing protein [Auriculariopsis ampla]